MANSPFQRAATALSGATEAQSPGSVSSPTAPEPLAQPPQRGRLRWLVIGAAVVVIGLITWAMVARRSSQTHSAAASSGDPSAPAEIRTASVRRGDFVRTVRVHGTSEAIQARPISAPRLQVQGLNTLVITRLVPSGSRVKKGDLLVEFDRQAQIKQALDQEATYKDFLSQIEKKKADQANGLAKDQSELKQAEDALASATLEVQRNEILSRIQAEENVEALDEAKAKLKQLRETFDLKRKAAEADLRVLEIQRDRALNSMHHAEGNAEKLSIHSPMDGMAVLNTIWKGGSQGEVMEGDEIRAGVPFMQVINPSQMQVRARVNQADIPNLRGGEDVQVHLDAYPELVFPGKVEQLAAIGSTGSFSNKVRTFVVTFSVEGSNLKLMPDLSAGVDVVIERRSGALLVPRDAVFTEGNQSYVRIARGSSFEKHAVKVGAMSDTEVVIESGLDAGATVQRAAASSPAPNGGASGSSS
jgi:multidrug efflux pump subunit AcrA (membrane-fusion protein)